MSLIKNAAPQNINLGTQDLSGRIIKPERDPFPQHLAKLPILARKGTNLPIVTSNIKLAALLGSETFDKDGVYYNHQTRFLEVISGQNNTVMVQRMIPSDAGIKSNVVLYADVLVKKVPNYVRNSLGDYVIDPATNNYKIDTANPTIPGVEIKYIIEHNDTNAENPLGGYITKQGTMSTQVDNDDVKLVIAEDLTSMFTSGSTITGSDSSAEGTVSSIDYDGTNSNIIVTNITGTYQTDETVTNGTDTSTETISSIDTDLTDTVYSTMYPVVELKAKYQGEYYNNIGFSLESLFEDDVLPSILEETKAIPYKLTLWTRDDKNSTPKVLRTLLGDPSAEVVFKEKAKNPLTDVRFDISSMFNTQWFNETDILKTLRYADYEGLYVYKNNFNHILNIIMNNEKSYISDDEQLWDDGLYASTRQWFDYNTSDPVKLVEEELYLTNIFKCVSTKNKKYFTVMINDEAPVLTGTQKEVTVSKNTPIFLNGGSDGTLDNEHYEEQVVKMLEKYSDNDSEVMDTAINVESVMYDSGFTLETKKNMVSFIGLRKDTLIALSTHDAALGEKYLPLVDERAIAVALKARLRLAPESEYFGTPVMRAIIVGGTGLLRNGSTLDRIPLTYEIAKKSAKFMGSGDFKWKANKTFDHGDGAVLEELVDIQPRFIPAGIKPTLWNDGIVWAQPKDRVQYFFPAIQTVYEDDTSVLNAWPVAFACATLSKIADDAWREFTGSTFLKDVEFVEAVTKYLNERADGIFAGLLTVIPNVYITEKDELRGYSWTASYKLYSANMKTVMVYHTEAYRASDLNQ